MEELIELPYNTQHSVHAISANGHESDNAEITRLDPSLRFAETESLTLSDVA